MLCVNAFYTSHICCTPLPLGHVGKAFGSDIRAAAAAGGRKNAGRNLNVPARPDKKAAYAELTGVAQEETSQAGSLGVSCGMIGRGGGGGRLASVHFIASASQTALPNRQVPPCLFSSPPAEMMSNPETASKRQLPADLVAQLEAREPYKPAKGQGKQLLINEQVWQRALGRGALFGMDFLCAPSGTGAGCWAGAAMWCRTRVASPTQPAWPRAPFFRPSAAEAVLG